MKNKSLIFYKDMDQLVKDPPKYGQLLFESYWKRDSSGAIIESQPTTSEYLDSFFWPFAYQINGLQITLNGAESGFYIEQVEGLRGEHIERVIFKPSGPLDFNKINETPIKITLDNFVNI